MHSDLSNLLAINILNIILYVQFLNLIRANALMKTTKLYFYFITTITLKRTLCH